MSDEPTVRDHLSVETLADLHEGLLDARASLAARGHLVGCPRCSRLARDVGDVPDLLAAHADVGPVPDDVAERLDAALAAERVGGPAPVTAAEDVTPTATEHRAGSPWGMRVLQAAAALVLVLAGIGLGVTAWQDGDDDAARTTTAEDSAGSAASPNAAGGYPVSASGQNWSEDTVVERVPDLLAGSFPAAPPAEGGAAAEGGDDGPARQLADAEVFRLSGGKPLAECVAALIDGPGTPLSVDLATWQGRPAAVILLPTPDDPATLDVWVVGPGCSTADAQVLHFARVARP